MKIIWIILFLSTALYVNGQNDQRYSEEDIAEQGLFIKATQQKLIGKLDKAIELYNQILEKDKFNAVALFELSRIYFEKESAEQAIEYGEKALKRDPKNLWYKESLAEIYFYFKEYLLSAEVYEQLTIDNKQEVLFYYRAQDAYEKGNNSDAALRILTQLEGNFGFDYYSIQETTRILLNQERYKEALEKSQLLLEKYPNRPDYLLFNAQLQRDFGSKEMAKLYFKQLLKSDPENSEALVFIASINSSNDKLGEIQSIASNKAVDIDSKIKALIPFVTNLNSASTDKDRILSLAKTIKEKHPEEAKAAALLGDIYYNLGELISAEKEYLYTIELDKSVFPVWQQLMIVQHALKKYAELRVTSFNAMDFYPNQAYSYVFNALAQFELTDYNEAKSMLSEAMIIGTKDEYLQNIIFLLSARLEAINTGHEIKEVSKEDLLLLGISTTDPAVIKTLSNGRFLIKVLKQVKEGNP